MLPTVLFYLFAGLLCVGAVCVVSMRRPVHAVLMLIFSFFNAAALFVLIGAEYLAMTLVIVYVGAVAILFLFVVMMLDIHMAEIKQGFNRMLPFGLVMGAGFVALVVAKLLPGTSFAPAKAGTAVSDLTNTHQIGAVLYTQYVYPFQVSGLILLVAMVGAILLTLRKRGGVLRQDVRVQMSRTHRKGVELVDVPSGRGVKL